MIEVKGITNITRSSPCARAWASAKASEVSVLPPPVGTVSVNTPCGSAALINGCAQHIVAQRIERTWGNDALPAIHACSAVSSAAIEGCSTSCSCARRPRASKAAAARAVCVDKAGENHAGQEGDPKPGFLFGPRMPSGPATFRGNTRPSAWAARSTVAEQVSFGLDATFRAKQIVLQPSMVPRDHMREQPAPCRR